MTEKLLILFGLIITGIGIYLLINKEKPENLHTLGTKEVLVVKTTRTDTNCSGEPCILYTWDEASFQDLKTKAEQGNIESQQQLGYLYLTGEFPQKNLKKAEEWLTRASEKNDNLAQEQLAYLYQEQGNMKKAEEWYRKSSSNGNLNSRNNLVLLLMDKEAEGQFIDKKELIFLLKSLIEKNYKPAFYTLAWLYIEDNEIKNESEGLKLLIIAAENGDTDAEYMLAELYEDGYLVEKNLQKSRELYAKAASKQMPEAIEKIRIWEVNHPEAK